MSEQQALAFIEHVSQDDELHKLFMTAFRKDIEQVVIMAATFGYHFTTQEFARVFVQFNGQKKCG